jgi:excisionase family DNA binding protein
MSDAEVDALPPVIRVGDVARWLDISTDLVYKLAAAGELPSLRLGGRALRFNKQAVAAFIAGESA